MPAEINPVNLSIVIPVFNERETIGGNINAVASTPFNRKIIVVDDGSTDGMRDYISSIVEENLKVVMLDRNQGKGAAL